MKSKVNYEERDKYLGIPQTLFRLKVLDNMHRDPKNFDMPKKDYDIFSTKEYMNLIDLISKLSDEDIDDLIYRFEKNETAFFGIVMEKAKNDLQSIRQQCNNAPVAKHPSLIEEILYPHEEKK